jgi:sugar/nucleoside kinase (ribokinase family)
VKQRGARRREIVCGGEILWDFFEERAGSYRRCTGGASANAAIALARLGVGVALVGAVGDDALGEALVAAVAREGVDVGGVARVPAPTGIVIKTSGRFTPYRADVLVRAAAAVAPARWALVGSMRPTVLGLRAASLAVDLNVRPRLWPSKAAMRAAATELVRPARLVKASNNDLARLWGTEAAGLAWLGRVAPRATVLVTRADEPASALGAWGKVDVAARRLRGGARESTGAGDAFMAGALAVVLRAGDRWDTPEVLTRALRIGHRLGAKAASRIGATTGLTNLEKIPWPQP